LIWTKTIGGSLNDYGMSIIATTDGNYVIAGYRASSNGDVPGNVGQHDFYIAKLTEQGNIIWSKNYGFSGHDHAHKIIQTKDGGFFIAGFADYSGIDESGGTQDNGAGHEIGHKNVLHGVGEYFYGTVILVVLKTIELMILLRQKTAELLWLAIPRVLILM
jgi:hypothetical protein